MNNSAAKRDARKEGLFMKNEERMREIREAKIAGQEALYSLRQAQEKLNSAKNWGLWDMFGGGIISTMMKHSRINDASSLMEDAKWKLQKFQQEVRDVQMPTQFRVEVGEFLTFADFFFDGFIADWMVQSRIGDARAQVAEAIEKVEQVLRRLDNMEDVIDVDYREV